MTNPSADHGDIWTRLRAPLDPSAIKTRQGQGGRVLRYIDQNTVRERLDSAATGEWDFRLGEAKQLPAARDEKEERGRDGDAIAVSGHLTVLGVTRGNWGQGGDFKSAATDAFKRCALMFGIGEELYEKDAAPAPSAPRPAVTAPRAATPAPSPSTDEVPCPKCGGEMWDNRATKRNPKAPDWKCRDRSCDGVVWPPRPNAARAAIPEQEPYEGAGLPEDDELPF